MFCFDQHAAVGLEENLAFCDLGLCGAIPFRRRQTQKLKCEGIDGRAILTRREADGIVSGAQD